MKLIKEKLTGIIFLSVLLWGMFGSIILEDQVVSYGERRRLATLPEYTVDKLISGTYFSQMDTYVLDHFIGREIFRTLKAEFDLIFLGKLDSNGYYLDGNHIYQIQATTNTSNVERAGNAFEKIVQTYFPQANIYYSIIPDKTYFAAEIPQLNYEEIENIMVQTFVSGSYIDISDKVALKDYYETDLHWKQEEIKPIADYLLAQMNHTDTAIVEYEQILAKDDFLGGYGANSAFDVKKDLLYYLTNEELENALVVDYETNQEIPVYTLDKVEGMDPYDVFLSGAKPLLTIEKESPTHGRELLLFRDSFGSSIAPFFMEGYDKITIVDLRYVTISYALTLLGDTEYDDVLFLYNTLLLHNSNSMKL